MSVIAPSPASSPKEGPTTLERLRAGLREHTSELYDLPLSYLGLEATLPLALLVEDNGTPRYEPALRASPDDPVALLDLCFFAAALDELTGTSPRALWLVGPDLASRTALPARPALAYWRHHLRYCPTPPSLAELSSSMLAPPLDEAPGPILFEEPEDVELTSLAEQLRRSSDPSHQLLADLLFYWRRERSAQVTAALEKLRADPVTRLLDDDVISDLEYLSTSRSPRAKNATTHYSFPDQDLSMDAARPGPVIIADGSRFTFGSLVEIDPDSCTLALRYDDALRLDNLVPTALTADDWVSAGKKPEALKSLARTLLANKKANPASMAILRASDPSFSTPQSSLQVPLISPLVSALSSSYLPVQGPPGTGKTYQGARAIYDALLAKRRVGICATSHAAIENLLEAVVGLFVATKQTNKLRALKKYSGDLDSALSHVTYTRSNADAANPSFNLVAGTTWLFADPDVAASNFDLLVIDEAGQMSLADALVASLATKNVLLLGDPLQLPQVTHAVHPHHAGSSVLTHVLGTATVPESRGIFLSETRRMHPDLCDFISDHVYDSRLTPHPSTNEQVVHGHGTGLRRVVATHDTRTRSSLEEADLVVDLAQSLLGESWTDASGTSSLISPKDILVVTPYNDQVDVLRSLLDLHPLTADIEVGTVDRFQGREAPVVLYTLTTSSATHMPRATSFLFSKNRLNVAVSRARCLAYLVCTDALLDTRARSTQEIELIGTTLAASQVSIPHNPTQLES